MTNSPSSSDHSALVIPSGSSTSAVLELGEAVTYIFRHYGIAIGRVRLNIGLSKVSPRADDMHDAVEVLDALGIS